MTFTIKFTVTIENDARVLEQINKSIGKIKDEVKKTIQANLPPQASESIIELS